VSHRVGFLSGLLAPFRSLLEAGGSTSTLLISVNSSNLVTAVRDGLVDDGFRDVVGGRLRPIASFGRSFVRWFNRL